MLKKWISENFLSLNSDETEMLVIAPTRQRHHVDKGDCNFQQLCYFSKCNCQQSRCTCQIPLHHIFPLVHYTFIIQGSWWFPGLWRCQLASRLFPVGLPSPGITSVNSEQHCISLTFVFVFCSHKLQPVLLSTLSIASTSTSSLSSPLGPCIILLSHLLDPHTLHIICISHYVFSELMASIA